jgi:hypothetical protein
MTKKEYNAKIVDIFKRMKPLFDEYLELEKKNTEKHTFSEKAIDIIADCIKPFLEAENIKNSYDDYELD